MNTPRKGTHFYALLGLFKNVNYLTGLKTHNQPKVPIKKAKTSIKI